MNENSNYRRFYCNDPRFFLKVIDQEQPPFKFKIHAFSDSRQQQAPREDNFRNSDKLVVFKKLDDYGATEVKDTTQSDRLRFTFQIEEKDKALELFE